MIPISLRSILILSSHLRFPKGLFPVDLPAKIANYLQCLWNPEVQCRIHKRSPIIHILSRINRISRMIPISLGSILILSYLRFPKGLFPVGLPGKIPN